MMTTPTDLAALLPIALDMTASLTAEDRSRRLVDAVVRALPCDAAVLLRLEGQDLWPVAAHGLAPDVLGRRFPRGEHPRLDAICRATAPTRFPADSGLPDPYDGLVEGAPHLDVHACLGCPLRVEGELIGVLTVDSLEPGAFDGVGDAFLAHLAALAAAALRTSDLIVALEEHARHQGLVAHDLVEDARERGGGPLIGASPPMQRLRRELELVARTEFPVLIVGETGVGKEIVARQLHALSPRADKPLVYVNCAALPESVVESELFGHARGAFTGAEKERPGKFRVAAGATLFLDEIGELPLHVQPKLLRTLQEGEIQPLGTDHPVHVDVRVIAATNRDLDAEVRAGRFRADLLHRLDVCRLSVPALRERLADVARLAGHFADGARRRLGTGPIRFEPETLGELERSAWPGNVRELANTVSRAVLRASARVARGEPVFVEPGDLGVSAGAPLHAAEPSIVASRAAEEARIATTGLPGARAGALLPAGVPLRDALRDYQRAAITAALERRHNSWAAAARDLGMHRSNLHHLATRLGLREAPSG